MRAYKDDKFDNLYNAINDFCEIKDDNYKYEDLYVNIVP